jgi:hypothetical protein
MTLSPSKFKHPLVVQILIAIAVAVFSSYLTLLQASIPRNEVDSKIKASEERQMNAVEKLETKQDKALEKLEDLQIKVGIIADKLKDKK